MTFEPSAYQQAIFDWVKSGAGCAKINALAGAGKSTTILHASSMIDGTGVLMAFNAKIAKENNAKLKAMGSKVVSMTLHSAGNAMLRTYLGKLQSPKLDKYKLLAKTFIEEQHIHPDMVFATTRTLVGLVSKTMLTLTEPENQDALLDLIYRFQLFPVDAEEPPESLLRVDVVLNGVPELLKRGQEQAEVAKEINFDDMVYLPIRLNLKSAQQYDWVFIDEAQDLNMVQRKLTFAHMKEGGRLLMVGDPRQAIYAFAGAEAESFHEMGSEVKAIELPLSICYRCPTSHLDLARRLVPRLENAPNAQEGEIKQVSLQDLTKEALPGDIVLSRFNAPLVSLCFTFVKEQRPAVITGKDLGAPIISILRSIEKAERKRAGFSLDRLPEYIERWYEKQRKNLEAKGDEDALATLTDRYQVIDACLSGIEYTSLDELCDEISKLLGTEDRDATRSDAINLMTIHKAKGLEGDRVWILGYDGLPFRHKNMTPVQEEQEKNLVYVALTRAKKSLFLHSGEKDKYATKEEKKPEVPKLTKTDEIASKLPAAVNLVLIPAETPEKPQIKTPGPVLINNDLPEIEFWKMRALKAEKELEELKRLFKVFKIVENGGMICLRAATAEKIAPLVQDEREPENDPEKSTEKEKA